MKWQDFYFNWLEKIGFYDWFNATLVGYKTPSPVGGRSNIGTVGFGGTGEPSIQDVPYIPTYSHPAQSLIESQLADSGPLANFNAAFRGRSRNYVGLFPRQVNEQLESEAFQSPQKNTLRYWGYQPHGKTFTPPSNFYRGYSYYSNAMKQKKELRGPRGDVLIRGSKKSWFTDKKNRTYPSVRMIQTVPMLGIRHPDYSHYGDVGNLMEIAWGRMNGLSYSYNEAGVVTRDEGMAGEFLDTLEQELLAANILTDLATSESTNYNLSRGQYLPPRSNNLNPPDIEEYITFRTLQEGVVGDQNIRNATEITNFMQQKYADNKGVILRNKKFREIDYLNDKVRHDTRQQINNLLLSIDNEMSVTTAEVILQILANPMLGVNSQGDIVRGPIQEIIDEFIFDLIPRDTVIKLQELLLMHGPQIIPTMSGGNWLPSQQNQRMSNQTGLGIGSFYFGIPMNKLQFCYPSQVSGGQSERFQWLWNDQLNIFNFKANDFPALMRGSTGYEELFANQNTAGVALEVMGMWQNIQVVDESLMPLIESLINFLPTIESSNYQLPQFGNLKWLYSLPTWVNPNYAVAIANSEIQNATSVDWQPKDIGFRINGRDTYLYEVKLRDWADKFLNEEPDMSNQKYWNISMLFNQPITKKARGATERQIEGVHQIILDLSPTKSRGGSSIGPVNQYIKNNLGMVECNATEEHYRGVFQPDEDLVSITYEFFGDVVEWPLNLVYPTNSVSGSPEGEMQSYLTPMDNDSDWWNQFLDGEEGILSMQVSNQNPNGQPDFEGWFIGWDFGYMDSIIQKAKVMGRGWAENLTLEGFCKKVYPSETVKAHFYPKQEAPALLEGETSNEITNYAQYGGRIFPLTQTPFTNVGSSLLTAKAQIAASSPEKLVFLPFEVRHPQSAQDSTRVRLNRPNELGGLNHIRQEETNRLLASLSNPCLVYTSPEDWLNYIENDEGYYPTLQPASFRNRIGPASFNSNSFRNNRLSAIIEAGAIEPLPRVDKTWNNVTYMFQENGGVVAIPKFSPVVKSWDANQFEEASNATGYNQVYMGFTGNFISLSHESRGEAYEPNFRSVAKCIINEQMPADILEVEEMPQSFVGRDIDYTMPSGNFWRRGKIFLINWVSILTPTILGILTPTEE